MKASLLLLVTIVLAVPGIVQEKVRFSRIDVAVGYGYISLPSFLETQLGIGTRRHSGFGLQQTFNLDSIFAVGNYFGYYALGKGYMSDKTHLIADMLGGRISLRRPGHVVPNVSAGLGGATTRAHPFDPPNFQRRTESGMSIKIGGGGDIRFNTVWSGGLTLAG